MAGEINGSDVTLRIEDPAGSGTYTVLGSQGDLEIERASDFIDTSSKDDRAQTGLAGRLSSTGRVRKLFVPSASEYLRIVDAMENGTLLRLRTALSGTENWQADVVVTRLPESYPDQGAAEVNIEFTVSGRWTAV